MYNACAACSFSFPKHEDINRTVQCLAILQAIINILEDTASALSLDWYRWLE